jgi:hypothetical protein
MPTRFGVRLHILGLVLWPNIHQSLDKEAPCFWPHQS